MIIRSLALFLLPLLPWAAPAWAQSPTQQVILELTGMR
jgi:hypothetical protein